MLCPWSSVRMSFRPTVLPLAISALYFSTNWRKLKHNDRNINHPKTMCRAHVQASQAIADKQKWIKQLQANNNEWSNYQNSPTNEKMIDKIQWIKQLQTNNNEWTDYIYQQKPINKTITDKQQWMKQLSKNTNEWSNKDKQQWMQRRSCLKW